MRKSRAPGRQSGEPAIVPLRRLHRSGTVYRALRNCLTEKVCPLGLLDHGGMFSRPGLLGSPGLVFPTQAAAFGDVDYARGAIKCRRGSVGRAREVPEIGGVESVDVAGRVI